MNTPLQTLIESLENQTISEVLNSLIQVTQSFAQNGRFDIGHDVNRVRFNLDYEKMEEVEQQLKENGTELFTLNEDLFSEENDMPDVSIDFPIDTDKVHLLYKALKENPVIAMSKHNETTSLEIDVTYDVFTDDYTGIKIKTIFNI